MKKAFVFVLMMLCAGMAAQAQTIHLDHHFWDGYSLYTVKEIRMGKYFYMTTSQGDELTLEKVDGKQGEYKILSTSFNLLQILSSFSYLSSKHSLSLNIHHLIKYKATNTQKSTLFFHQSQLLNILILKNHSP